MTKQDRKLFDCQDSELMRVHAVEAAVMNQRARAAASMSAVTLLAACGGGGGGDDASSDVVAVPIPSATFLSTLGVTGNSHVATAADLNNDGRDEVILHYWSTNFGRLADGTLETNDSLLIYTFGPDGSASIANRSFFGSDIVSLGAGSRDIAVGDINGDGFVDFALAMNRDDGRIISPGQQLDDLAGFGANAVVVLSSSSGQYSVVTLPNVQFWHIVELVPNSDGGMDVLFCDDMNTAELDVVAYRFTGTSYTRVSEYPYIHNNSASFASDPLDSGRDLIFSTTYTPNDFHPSLTLYAKEGGTWTATDEIAFLPVSASLTFNSDALVAEFGTKAVYVVEDKYVFDLVFWEVTTLQSEDGSMPLLLAQASGQFVNIQAARDGISNDEITTGSYWMVFRTDGSNLFPVTGMLGSQNIAKSGFYYDVRDFNDDGFEDILVWPYVGSTNPRDLMSATLYLNDGKGSLVKDTTLDLAQLSTDAYSMPRGVSGSFDGDSSEDALYFSQNLYADVNFINQAPVVYFDVIG